MDPDEIVQDALERLDGAFAMATSYMTTKLHEILATPPSKGLHFYGDVMRHRRTSTGAFPAKLRAAHDDPAIPGAPPRRISGELQSHVSFDHLGIADWVWGIRSRVPYAFRLENYMGHPYMRVVIQNNLNTILTMVRDEFRRA